MSGNAALRILVVNWLDRLNPRAGGAETHLHEIFGRLVQRGHEVTLLCSGWSGAAPKEVVDGITVHRSGQRYSFNLSAPLAYRKALAQQTFDIVVEDLNKVPLFTRSWARARRHVVLVHHLFGATAFQEANPFLAGATWLLERTVPGLLRGLPCISVSESTKEDLVARGAVADRIRVIPNGVDLERAHFGGPRAARPTALYLGRLKRYKRIDLFVKAMAELLRRGVDLDGVVAGRGDDRRRLERLVRTLNLEDRVRFEGYVTEDDKQRLLAKAWVHVYPSPKEGWGITNLEAAAAGTPSVASNSPGLRETVVDGQTGYLVPHGDVGELAGAIARLLDPATRDRMGAAARRFAEAYSWDRVALEFEAALIEVARGGEARVSL